MSTQNVMDSPLEQPTVLPIKVSFAAILKRALGEKAWSKLGPDIAKRFAPELRETSGLCFKGSMQWVYCSPIGAILARFLRSFSILPGNCSRDSAFDFTIYMSNGEIRKQRRYGKNTKDAFIFRSWFRESPCLQEEFGGGIGMYLRLVEVQGALLFQDKGYFFRRGRWRIPVPGWFMVGRFELLHRNLDRNRFQVILQVVHPLLGTLFYQRGEFYASKG